MNEIFNDFTGFLHRHPQLERRCELSTDHAIVDIEDWQKARSMANSRVLTCVYCGHEYPQDTPASGDQVLTEHIKVCEKHPLRKAEEKIKKLRSALSGFVECKEEELTIELLQNMLELNNSFAPDERTKSVCAYAIQVLIETMEAGK